MSWPLALRHQLSNVTVIGVDFLDICLLSNDVMDYYIVSQGKTVIPGVDDGEEMRLTDVSSGRDRCLDSSPDFSLLSNFLHAIL